MISLKKKSILFGASMLLCAAPAFASNITVDNISFPAPNNGHNTNGYLAGTLFENTVSGPGDVSHGYGEINTFQGSTDFCATGTSCQLTFTFGGYKLDHIDSAGPTNKQNIFFTDGWVKFYANDSQTFNKNDANSATDGQLFLSLNAVPTIEGTDYTLNGTGSNLTNDGASGFGQTYLNVIGGDAADVFDTNAYQIDDLPAFDLKVNTSFSPGGPQSFTGSADAHYPTGSTAVPEPSPFAMLGLGVFLLAAGLGWRKRHTGA
jgi:hypothetical protein